MHRRTLLLLAILGACTPGERPPNGATSGNDPIAPPRTTATATAPPATATAPRADASPEPAAPIPDDVRAILDARHLELVLPGDHVIEAETNSRFAFRARPADGAFELRYGLGAAMDDTSSIEPMVERAAFVFTHNFARDNAGVCPPVPLPKAMLERYRADAGWRMCFPPAGYLGERYGHGVCYALFRRNVGLLLLVVLTNDPTAPHVTDGLATFGLTLPPRSP